MTSDCSLMTSDCSLMTSDDALGVAVHRAKGYVASSQKAYRERGRARKPTVWVWRLTDEGVIEALTKGPLVFTGCNQRWVSLLCFNTTGELLCSVGADDDNTLVLWDWQVPDGTGWHWMALDGT